MLQCLVGPATDGAGLSQASDLADPQQVSVAVVLEPPFGMTAAVPRFLWLLVLGPAVGTVSLGEKSRCAVLPLPPRPAVILSQTPHPIPVPSDRGEDSEMLF